MQDRQEKEEYPKEKSHTYTSFEGKRREKDKLDQAQEER